MNKIQYKLDFVGNFRLGNFATGSYNCICVHCKKPFIGDKRAVQCLECAITYINNILTKTRDIICDNCNDGAFLQFNEKCLKCGREYIFKQ